MKPGPLGLSAILLFLTLPGTAEPRPDAADVVRITPDRLAPVLVFEREYPRGISRNTLPSGGLWTYLPAAVHETVTLRPEGELPHDTLVRQEWPLSPVWAWSCSVRRDAPLRIILPDSMTHWVDSLTDLSVSSQRRNGAREYFWQAPELSGTGYAPRPHLVSLGTVSSQTGLAHWLIERYVGQPPSALGAALARSAAASSRGGAFERAAWIHQSLVQGAGSLDPQLLPGKGRQGVYSSADYARDFLHAATVLGLAARLIVPLSPRLGLPLGMVGLHLASGNGERWYFPASRVFPPGRVPWYLNGLEALLIDSRATVTRVRLAADTGGSSGYTLRLAPGRDGKLTASISGEYEGVDAALVRAEILVKGKGAVFSAMAQNSVPESLSVRHVFQLQSPLLVDGSLAKAITLSEADSILDTALRSRFADGRSGDWTDRLVITIPAGSRTAGIPPPETRSRDGGRMECRWKLVQGKTITKPVHWTQADWQRWVRTNIARQPDTLIRERTLHAGSSTGRRTIASMVDDLEDYGMPTITLYRGGRLR